MSRRHIAWALSGVLAAAALLVGSAAANAAPVTLHVEIASGIGQITGDVAGVSCERASAAAPTTTCDVAVDGNATVTLTAHAGTGYEPGKQDPQCTSSGTPAQCQVAMGGFSRTVSFDFIPSGRLTVFANGWGSVKLDPPPVVDVGSSSEGHYVEPAGCTGADPVSPAMMKCTVAYLPGTTVTATATPRNTLTPLGNTPTFAGWGQPDCVGLAECRVTVADQPQTITGNFAPARIDVQWVGAGQVTSQPACGLAGGGRCTVEVPPGTPVTLTATGDMPINWYSGCTEPQGATCTIIANSYVWWTVLGFNAPNPGGPAQVSTNFKVLHGGSGAGIVQGRKLDCGAQCSGSYLFGAGERLVAKPAAGSSFTRWSGACGTNPVCELSVGPVNAIRAIFDKHSDPGPGASNSGGSGPGGAGPTGPGANQPGTSRLTVRGVRSAIVGRGSKRRIIVRIVVDRAARTAIRLRRGRRTLLRHSFMVRTGSNRRVFRIPRHARAGRARLLVRVSAAGQTRSFTRTVRLGR